MGRISEFPYRLNPVICNIMFMKQGSRLVTYVAGYVKSTVDYIMVRQEDKAEVVSSCVVCCMDVERLSAIKPGVRTVSHATRPFCTADFTYCGSVRRPSAGAVLLYGQFNCSMIITQTAIDDEFARCE